MVSHEALLYYIFFIISFFFFPFHLFLKVVGILLVLKK